MGNLQRVAVIMALWSGHSFGAALVEREGRFEWNWSTGNVRYYGTSLSDAADGKSWRPAEQRAWSDGLAQVEQQLPGVVGSRLGSTSAEVPKKFSNMLAATRSVSTTYFGDNKIKVALETPITAALKQVKSNDGAAPASTGGSGQLVVKVPKSTAPAIAFSVVDETGKELVGAKQILASVTSGNPAPRWFKSSPVAPDASAVPAETPVIKASSSSKGVIKVNAADWRPEYAAIVLSGRAAIVVQ